MVQEGYERIEDRQQRRRTLWLIGSLIVVAIVVAVAAGTTAGGAGGAGGIGGAEGNIVNSDNVGGRSTLAPSSSMPLSSNPDPSSPAFCFQSPTHDFVAYALVEFNGIPDLFDASDLEALETAFLTDYNALAEKLCDASKGSFRVLTSVSIIVERRDQQRSDEGPMVIRAATNTHTTATSDATASMLNQSLLVARSFAFQFRARGHCRGCLLPNSMFLMGDSGKNGTANSMATAAVMNEGGCMFCAPPSFQKFTNLFNATVHSFFVNNTAVDGVLGLTELESVPCSDEINEFETNVFVGFVGNLSAATTPQILTLAQAFRDAYNSLNRFDPVTCDLLFRQATEVDINVDTNHLLSLQFLLDSLYNGEKKPCRGCSTMTAFAPFVFRFQIRGRCRGCPHDTDIFDDGFRRLLEGSSSLFPLQQIDGSSGNDCVCAVDSQEFRAPTREEFGTALDSTMERLAEEERVVFINEVVDVTEVGPVNCSGQVGFFFSDVFVNFVGDPDATSASDENLLEVAFSSTYNELALMSCDPFFRSVMEAQIVEVITDDTSTNMTEQHMDNKNKTGMSDNNATNATDPMMFSSFRYRFRVAGRCRGCPEDTSIFDDGFRRRLRESTTRSGSVHRLEQEADSTCYCDRNSLDESRAPTNDEFEVQYSETVASLNIPNIHMVANVTEPTPSPNPAPLTSMPVAPAPVIATGPATAPPATQEPSPSPLGFPPCNICGGSLRISVPEAIVVGTVGQAGPVKCKHLQFAGDFGNIDPEFCLVLSGFLDSCGCVESGYTLPPTPVPTPLPSSVPTTTPLPALVPVPTPMPT